MIRDEIARWAREAFHNDAAAAPPPLTLRGGDSVDSYRAPEPYDDAIDDPSDGYIARFAYFALPHLDARSWRYALPHLIGYVLRCENEPTGLIATAVIQTMAWPEPEPRLVTLSPDQRSVLIVFLMEMSHSERPDIREAAGHAFNQWITRNR